MKTVRYALVGLWMLVLMGGCASREDTIVLENRLYTQQRQTQQFKEELGLLKNQLNTRADQIEKKMESGRQPLLENQASSLNEIETLKSRLQVVQGRLEALEYSQKKETNARTTLDSLTKDLKEVQQRLQRLEQSASSGVVAAAEAAKAEQSKETVKEPKVERKEEKEKARPASPEDLFEEAGEAYKQKHFEEARKKFDEYLKQSPKGKNREEAFFKMAESLYELKTYEESILVYQKLIKANPKGRLVPGALYKQALSFLQLKDSGSAKLLLEKIVKEYPKSEQAQTARKKLKTL